MNFGGPITFSRSVCPLIDTFCSYFDTCKFLFKFKLWTDFAHWQLDDRRQYHWEIFWHNITCSFLVESVIRHYSFSIICVNLEHWSVRRLSHELLVTIPVIKRIYKSTLYIPHLQVVHIHLVLKISCNEINNQRLS